MRFPVVSRFFARSLASRVTLLTTMAVGISVATVALAAYVTVRTQTMHSLDQSLKERASAASRSDALDRLAAAQIPPWAIGAADINIIFVRLDNVPEELIADGNKGLRAGSQEYTVAAGRERWSARTVSADGRRYRMVAVHAGRDEALVLAQSLEPTDRVLRKLGLVFLLFGLAGMLSAGVAGWGVARNGLRPVRRLTAAAEEIARTQKLAPIPVEGNDEVARLSIAFNAMLTALDASRSRQRQLVADAGHELRTPLTSLRTNLDLLAQADEADRAGAGTGLSTESRGELLEDVRAQIEELTTLIGDLVEVAREDPIAPTVEPVELAAVIGQAVARARRRVGPESGIEFDVRAQPWWVVGEAAALERALTNLLDNAVKWSPVGGRVTVRLVDGSVYVGDEGDGIEADDLPFVFDRFYRATQARTMPGSGLGLSIVRTVAERHGGSVQAGESPPGGAAFWFTVPGSAAPPEVLARS